MEEKNQRVLQEVETLLSDLSTEFNVPMPMYCVYDLYPMKRLGEFKPPGSVSRAKISNPLVGVIPKAWFVSARKICYLVLFLQNRKFVGKENIVHEFFHYKHYVESDYDWRNRTSEEQEQEEKRTQSETRKYMKKLREKVK